MIKFVIAAIWISLATTGALVFSFKAGEPEVETEEEPNAFHGLDYVKTGVISVPLMREGTVYGYFLTRLVYTSPTSMLSDLKLPPEALISDEVYSYLYGNPQIDFASRENVDLDSFRNGIMDSVNERVGDKLIHEVLVEQMDFLQKSEIPSATIKRPPSATPAAIEPQDPQSGH